LTSTFRVSGALAAGFVQCGRAAAEALYCACASATFSPLTFNSRFRFGAAQRDTANNAILLLDLGGADADLLVRSDIFNARRISM